MIIDDWKPDVIIGVDFGMTCTGVAYAQGPDWGGPKQLQHWPGRAVHELANKVPTQIGYRKNSRQMKAWGFLSETQESDLDIEELFKLYLDPEYRDNNAHRPTLQQARTWFQDYLRGIHDHVNEHFSNTLPRWTSKKVEFVFSVPTSWNNASMIEETLKLIRGAGFGTDGPSHRVHIGLTEAEAAAVYAARQQFQRNDIILVCDAGGGTTDVNVLKLTSSTVEPTKLSQLTWVEGKAIGSALIDEEFRQLIESRLGQIAQRLSQSPEITAEKMLRKFERFKCAFGSGAADMPALLLPVPGLPPGLTLPNIAIEDSTMRLTRNELKAAFDRQINPMLALIDKQLERTERKHPGEQITYLVVSGGLGSSPYLKQRLDSHFQIGAGRPRSLEQRLESHLEGGRDRARSNTQQMSILKSEEPQLAVVLGLVMDRIQEVSRATVVFDERCCRVSYGMVCKELYNAVNHMGQDVAYDNRDRKKYALNQIDWFVEQGVNVPITGVSKPYRLKIKPYSLMKSWKTQIVMSELPDEQRPKSLKYSGDGVKRVCNVDASLAGLDMKLKNRHWYNRGEKYLRADFDVKVVIGPADLKFQIWDKGSAKLSRNEDSIAVRWDPPRSYSLPGNEEMTAEQRGY